MILSQFKMARQGLQKGLTMIEVLVSIVILAIGLLGAAVLQTLSLEGTANTGYRTSAMYLAQDLVDKMRANSVAMDDYGDVSKAAAKAACHEAAGCTSQEMAYNDLKEWTDAIADRLPEGVGSVRLPGVGQPNLEIDISWTERVKEAKGASETVATSNANKMETVTYTLATRIQ